MTWREISQNLEDGRDPRTAGVLLLKGKLDVSTLGNELDTNVYPRQTIRVMGYWDSLDEAWALTSTPWYGPFFLPTHYAVLPDSLDIH